MTLYVPKCHLMGPKNQEEINFSLVDRKSRTFLAIQALLTIHLWGRSTLPFPEMSQQRL